VPKLFVYSDERRGQPGHRALEREGVRFLGTARTGRGYRLADADGGFQLEAVLAPVGGPAVRGELYEVPDVPAGAFEVRLEDGSLAWTR
jgi:hypothetical protein